MISPTPTSDRCRDIVNRLLRIYETWPGPRRLGQVPEPFMGTCEPRVTTMFIGINPGAQRVPNPPQTVDQHIAHARDYFHQKKEVGWGVPRFDSGVWTKYGYFFPDASATPERRLTGPLLYQTLATRSMITNLFHWPTDSETTQQLLKEPWIHKWLARSTGFVSEMIAHTQPKLIVVQHELVWNWLSAACTELPVGHGRRSGIVEKYESSEPVGFSSALTFVAEPTYRPFVLRVMHLSGHRTTKEQMARYADEVARVPW